MLPTRYWITASALPKKRLQLPIVKKLVSLPEPTRAVKEEKELIEQFVLTEDGTPILITYTPQQKK